MQPNTTFDLGQDPEQNNPRKLIYRGQKNRKDTRVFFLGDDQAS
jgi:hypothetical protein